MRGLGPRSGRWLGLAVLLSGLVAWGQNYTPVTVVVTGPDGAAVAGAEIRVTPGSPAGDKLITDDQGRAQLGMPAGQYQLHVAAQGFAEADRSLVVADQPQTLTVALQTARAASGNEGTGAGPMPPGAVPLGMTTGATGSAEPGKPAVQAANVLTVVGEGGLRGVFTAKSLGEYPQQTVAVMDRMAKQQRTYAGVPLMELLAHLGVPKAAMGKALARYVVATGSDGFTAVLSLGEVDPAVHAGTVLVADAVDGKPLDAKAGPFQLVVSGDKRPVRSVRNLVKIEVRPVD
ncbi:MAG: carboxypeptidase regulatory-like domain-containing protein [Acidobacteriota bacterium]